jgi:uncharacterized protein YegP (UPF0339 family)
MKRPKFVVYKAADGYRWRLVAANGRQVAQGEAHTSRRDAVRACYAVFRASALAALRMVKGED